MNATTTFIPREMKHDIVITIGSVEYAGIVMVADGVVDSGSDGFIRGANQIAMVGAALPCVIDSDGGELSPEEVSDEILYAINDANLLEDERDGYSYRLLDAEKYQRSIAA